jgi:hypothetical protein
MARICKAKKSRAIKIGRTHYAFEQGLMSFIKDKEVYTVTGGKEGLIPLTDKFCDQDATICICP